MLDSLFGTGKLERMVIWALKPVSDPNTPPEAMEYDEQKYEVQINPESYTLNHNVHYTDDNAIGKAGNDPKYDHTSPTTLEFSIIFDGTGVVPLKPDALDNVPVVGAVASLFSDKKEFDVMTQIREFSSVVYDFSGEEHRPRRVRLTWGRQLYDGVLTSMSLNYKLFDASGTPLRVEARVTFKSALPDVMYEAVYKPSSPDLTHKRTAVAGDTLPLMTHRIYGKPEYYIEVAKSNRLYNFRKLREGRQVFFPPTKKSAS